MAPEGAFLQFNPHPRAYGNVARFLGRYVRERQVMSLQEAIRRLTTLPASSIAIRERGALQVGYFADVVVFDPATIADHEHHERARQLLGDSRRFATSPSTQGSPIRYLVRVVLR